jgi:hypothetical protein
MRRLGQNPKSEKLGDAELLLSSNDNWAAAFTNNYFPDWSIGFGSSLLVDSVDEHIALNG